MHRTTGRFIHAVLFVLAIFTVLAVPAHAQESLHPGETNIASGDGSVSFVRESVGLVKWSMQNGWESRGIHVTAADFVIECPIADLYLKDPEHPCNQYENGRAEIHIGNINEFVLVCPVADLYLKDPEHPCNQRRSQIQNADINDFVLVCPSADLTLWDPTHPCNEVNRSSATFNMPKDYVLTCPIADLYLTDPQHPCNRE